MILLNVQGLRFDLFGAVVDAEADLEQQEARRQHSQVPRASTQARRSLGLRSVTRLGELDGEGRRQALERQSPCRRHVGNGEVLQHSLSHRLYAARGVQRHIPVRRAKFWHQADLFGSAPAKDLPEAEARLDAIGESDSVPTRVGLEVAIVLPLGVRF